MSEEQFLTGPFCLLAGLKPMLASVSPNRLRRVCPHACQGGECDPSCRNNRNENCRNVINNSSANSLELEGSIPLLNGHTVVDEDMGSDKKDNKEEIVEFYGYCPHRGRQLATWFAVLLTLGLLRLVFHWRPTWMLYCTHKICSLSLATKILIMDQFDQAFVEDVKKMTADQLNKGPLVGTWIKDTEKPSQKFQLLQPGNVPGEFWSTDSLVFFDNKKVRYIWNSTSSSFVQLHGLDKQVPCSYFYNQAALPAEQQTSRQVLYGKNSIAVEVEPYFTILFSQVLEPFYIFQVFSMTVWFFDHYYYYATCIIFMALFSLTAGVIQIRKNQKDLRNTVKLTDVATVLRPNNETEQVSSEQLVPGDVIVLPRRGGCMIACDAVLISGNCIVNESMLTGESVPVTKTPLVFHSNELYNPLEHGKHTLFCGTELIQTRYYGTEMVKAIVVRTGFLTAKGELVRSIMFPKPVDFQFHRHIIKFILCLGALASIGFVYTIILKVQRGEHFKSIVIRALDLITIVIPPALPAAMTIGTVMAQRRLKKRLLYCISPKSINISGCINCVCFDKTGTLTEEGLDLWGLVPCQESFFQSPVKNPSQELPESADLMIGLAACHSLTLIEGKLSGDPLDLKMFESTGWELEECNVDDSMKYDNVSPTVVRPIKPHGTAEVQYLNLEQPPPFEVGIVRQFPFSSSLQRMSVITRTLGAPNFVVYTKGAPETISSLCLPESVPIDFSNTLRKYTEQGYRVLALGYKPLPKLSYAKCQRATREDIEHKLIFLGLLIMENRLKPESSPTIKELQAANIRNIMVTGDNLLTALSVARDCGMIDRHHQVIVLEAAAGEETISWHYADQAQTVDQLQTQDYLSIVIEKHDQIHLALTGKTFQVLYQNQPELLKKVAVRGTVFARMSPQQKQHLIEILQELDYYVAMCGDGANDCGALKAAHTGVSLSDTEASVASPFTSKINNISCIPILIKEGRCALVTSFGIVKYMGCYSLTQFISVLILYSLYTNLSDFQFLYIDLYLITVLAALFGRTKAYNSLAKRAPPSSLLDVTQLVSLLSQIALSILFQMAAVGILWTKPWYVPHNTVVEEYVGHDNYTIFAISIFQYIILAIILSKGAPYRKPLYTNWLLTGALVIMTATCVYIILGPAQFLIHWLELATATTPLGFRGQLLLLALFNFCVSLFFESIVVDYVVVRLRGPPSYCYSRLEEETRGPPTWLPSILP